MWSKLKNNHINSYFSFHISMYFKNDGCFAVENPSSQRKVGSISDYDPMNDRWGSVTGQHGMYWMS